MIERRQKLAAYDPDGNCVLNNLKMSDWDRANQAKAVIEQ